MPKLDSLTGRRSVARAQTPEEMKAMFAGMRAMAKAKEA